MKTIKTIGRLRRSMLFCPANKSKMLYSAVTLKPDAIIFDLEDAVPYSEKEEARDLLCEALQTIDYGNIEVFARINAIGTEFFEQDVRMTVQAGLRFIRPPMIESAADIKKLESLLDSCEKEYGIQTGSVKILAAFETPKAIINAYEICTASPRMEGIALGAEDFARTLGVNRSAAALRQARAQMVLAANAAGIDAIDTSFTALDDTEGFRAEALEAMQMGFAGKSCLHPNQVRIVHEIFTPSQEEIEKSKAIMEFAEKENIEEGGVLVMNGKMIDIPIIMKAKRVMELAKAAGKA